MQSTFIQKKFRVKCWWNWPHRLPFLRRPSALCLALWLIWQWDRFDKNNWINLFICFILGFCLSTSGLTKSLTGHFHIEVTHNFTHLMTGDVRTENQVDQSTTFYEKLFCTKVHWAPFIYLKFGFVIFLPNPYLRKSSS